MKLLILGPQGAGKGTQAELLAQHFGIPHISTGDIFRENIKNGTPLGQQVAGMIAAGELVPDSFTQAMVAQRLHEPDAAAGFLLDGFPRTTDQATWLDAMVGHNQIDAVLVLTAPPAVLRARAAARGRDDDTEEALERRLQLYRQETEPLLNFYGPITVTVDGNKPVDDVHHRILAALADERGLT